MIVNGLISWFGFVFMRMSQIPEYYKILSLIKIEELETCKKVTRSPVLKSNKLIIFLISLPFLMLIVFYSLNGHPGYSDDSNFIRNHVAAINSEIIAYLARKSNA